MNIDAVGPSIGAGAVGPVNPIAAEARPVETAATADVVEISNVARLTLKVNELPEIRADLVERVKAEIAAGTYETPERIDIAVNRLMEELLG
jgi:negative regulator of flagellin synthesis FlgM